MNSLFSHAERIRYIREFGSHSLAYSVFQPGLCYFDVAEKGFIPYFSFKNDIFVLSNPICAKHHLETLLSEFLICFPNAFFIQVSKDVIDVLNHKFSYYGTECGEEVVFPIANWSIKGKKKDVIRRALNGAKKTGVEIQEQLEMIESPCLSKKWLASRRLSKREIRYLIRPALSFNHEDVRRFYAYHNQNIVGFVFFDPIYRSHKIIGYVPSISRFLPNYKLGLWYVMLAYALEKFKQEGIEHMALGIMPMGESVTLAHHESFWFKKAIAFLYRYGNFLYHFQGLRFSKLRFSDNVEKVYYGHKKKFPFLSVVNLARATGFLK